MRTATTCFYIVNFAVYEQLESGIEVRLGQHIPMCTAILGHPRALDTTIPKAFLQ